VCQDRGMSDNGYGRTRRDGSRRRYGGRSGDRRGGRARRVYDDEPRDGSLSDLVGHLHALDDRSYAAYKAIVGRYEAPDGWVLHVDRVQPDPYAPPTRIRLEIPTDLPGLEILEDRELLATEDRRLAVRDFLTRELHTGFKGTNLSIAAPGQEILERSAVLALPEDPEDEETRDGRPDDKPEDEGSSEAGVRRLEVRARMALPARGRSIVVGANIGKTKATALVDAVEDYRYSAGVVARWADYLVVNVSSPNTPGLRTLQNVDALRPILEAVREAGDAAARRHVPLLVKIAPDLADEDIDAVADLVTRMGLDGVVATNTTIDHDLGEGGLSGAPLLPRSLEVVRRLRARLGEGPTIIGVGGISSIMDAELMLDAGADLLQAYSAFVYNGPAWPGRINRALATTPRRTPRWR